MFYVTASLLKKIRLWKKKKEKNEMVKPYTVLQSQGHVKMAYRCSKFNAYYLLVSSMPSLMMMTLIVSKESFARGTQTRSHTHTHTQSLVYINFFKVA